MNRPDFWREPKECGQKGDCRFHGGIANEDGGGVDEGLSLLFLLLINPA